MVAEWCNWDTATESWCEVSSVSTPGPMFEVECQIGPRHTQ